MDFNLISFGGQVEENELRGKASMSPSKKRKTVRFQEPVKDEPDDENVTYMPLEKDMEVDVPFVFEDRTWSKDKVRTDLRYGKFTKEDDERIKEAVFKYIKVFFHCVLGFVTVEFDFIVHLMGSPRDIKSKELSVFQFLTNSLYSDARMGRKGRTANSITPLRCRCSRLLVRNR